MDISKWKYERKLGKMRINCRKDLMKEKGKKEKPKSKMTKKVLSPEVNPWGRRDIYIINNASFAARTDSPFVLLEGRT